MGAAQAVAAPAKLRRLRRGPALPGAALRAAQLPAVRAAVSSKAPRGCTSTSTSASRSPPSATRCGSLGQTMLFIGASRWRWSRATSSPRRPRKGRSGWPSAGRSRGRACFSRSSSLCALYTRRADALRGRERRRCSVCVFEGPGKLVVVSVRESILGVHEFGPGLERYAAAMVLLARRASSPSRSSPSRCRAFRSRPRPRRAVTMIVLLGDWVIQAHPMFAPVSPYTLMTRLGVVAPGVQRDDPVAAARAELLRARAARRWRCW